MTAPAELETARLRLRGHRPDDFTACAAMWADPVVTRFIGGRPLSGEEIWARMLRYAGHWSWFGYGFWAIEEAATGRFVGELGFADFRREIDPPLGDRPEMGWALVAAAHGRGFAAEATAAALTWADARFGGRETVCLINPDNHPSLRVAAKCGYREWRRATYKDHASIVLLR
jgi:RimJ/RimL family protein N-acetyltransferase